MFMESGAQPIGALANTFDHLSENEIIGVNFPISVPSAYDFNEKRNVAKLQLIFCLTPA